MKKRMMRFCCGVMAAGLLFSGISSGGAEGVIRNHLLWNVTVAAETAVTVSNENEFLSALAQKQKNIIVTGSFSVTGQTETNGQMIPIEIPGATVITGNNVGDITFRGPIQIMGDGVVIRDIQIGFSSANTMNSVPHREIFLVGHSLTLDNVKTYLPGGGDAGLGGFAGTEKELLPTVYAGGYHSNTAVGTNASLTVTNANNKTMFQDIYLGHEASAGQRTAYTGSAKLELDADAKIRGTVSAENTSLASLDFLGDQKGYDEITLSEIKGNDKTVMTVKNCAVLGVVTTGVKDILLDAGGRLQPKDGTAQLNNITLKNGGCLDLTQVLDALVKGSFTGSDDAAARGKLVLNKDGYVQIDGQISGVTQFQTVSHVIPGTILSGHAYIASENGTAGSFVLSDTAIKNNYSLIHKNGTWTPYINYVPVERELGSIEVKSYPKNVVINHIPTNMEDKTGDSPYLNVIWKDQDGEAYTFDDVVNNESFYDNMVLIRSDYWNSDDEEIQQKTDWINPIRLDVDENEPDHYYLIAYGKVQTGKYTLLFCLEPIEGQLDTVADVKAAVKDIVKAEIEINFTDQDIEPMPHVHTEGKPVVENLVEAKAGVEGSYDKVVYCTTCHKELSREKVMIPALPEPDTEKPGTEVPEPDTEKPGTEVPEPDTEKPGTEVPEPDTEKPGTEVPEPDTEKPGTEMPEPDTEKPQPEHKHSYVLQKTTESTCMAEGEKIYSCACGDVHTEKIAKKTHTPEKNLTPAEPGSDGKIVTKCSVCNTVLQQETINAPKTIKLSKARYIYDGKSKKPVVNVIDNKGQVISGDFYKISYQKNKKIGKATVTVRFQGNYTGTLKGTFEICPKGTSVTNIKSGEKAFSLKWKKQTSQTSGYEIAYAADASFRKKSTKTVVLKSNKTTSKEVKGLKPGKKYYVKVRTYKEVKSGSKKVKIYSDWSKTKSVRIKK
mgnify:CR=1 FL=1